MLAYCDLIQEKLNAGVLPQEHHPSWNEYTEKEFDISSANLNRDIDEELNTLATNLANQNKIVHDKEKNRQNELKRQQEIAKVEAKNRADCKKSIAEYGCTCACRKYCGSPEPKPGFESCQF